jgi:hypothetical protein
MLIVGLRIHLTLIKFESRGMNGGFDRCRSGSVLTTDEMVLREVALKPIPGELYFDFTQINRLLGRVNFNEAGICRSNLYLDKKLL